MPEIGMLIDGVHHIIAPYKINISYRCLNLFFFKEIVSAQSRFDLVKDIHLVCVCYA